MEGSPVSPATRGVHDRKNFLIYDLFAIRDFDG